MFKVGDIVEFTNLDYLSDRNVYNNYRIDQLYNMSKNGPDFVSVKHPNSSNFITNVNNIRLDKEYYRKQKLKKICQKMNT